MQTFFAMGGYGFFVWGAFGVAALLITIMIIEPILHHTAALKQADDFHSDEHQ